jgi:hypothetical protein
MLGHKRFNADFGGHIPLQGDNKGVIIYHCGSGLTRVPKFCGVLTSRLKDFQAEFVTMSHQGSV